MVGQAFSFDGTNTFVGLAFQPSVATAFTISGWVNFDSRNFAAFQEIFNNNQFFLRKDSNSEGNKLSIFVKLTDGTVEPRAQSATVPTAGTWYYVAGTWDGTTLRMYVNGSLERSSLRRGTLTSTTVQARIGQGEQTSMVGNTFSGRIDELTIYNRALSDDEIKAIYDSGDTGMVKPQLSGDPYADWVLRYEPLSTPTNPDFDDPLRAVGAPDNRAVSLGGSGSILELAFVDNTLVNGEGADLRVLECGGVPVCKPGEPSVEAYDVYVMVNGSFVLLGNGSGITNFDLDNAGVVGPVTTLRIVDRGGGGGGTPGSDIDGVTALNSGPPFNFRGAPVRK